MPIILVFLMLMLSPGAIQAQDRLPEPSQLFYDTVEIIATETIENPLATPSVTWDDERREVTVVLEDGVVQYPYPEDVFGFSDLFPLIIQDQIVIKGYTMDTTIEAFILDLQTDTFARYEPQCGENSPEYFSNPSIHLWVVELTATGVRLCATLTGERTAPLELPDDFTPMPDTKTYLSQDFAYAVFFGAEGDVYSYAFASGTVRALGTLPEVATEATFAQWAGDNRHVAVNFRGDEQCATYVAEATQTSSLELALETVPYCGIVQSGTNPMRLVYYQRTPLSEEDSPFRTCTQTIYDISTGEQRFYDYGTLCKPDYGSAEGTGYYREVAEDRSKADVVRFNPATGERETLYTGGEVEWVIWVADDERFAVLLFDDNGQIDRLPGAYDGEWQIEQPRLALVELETGAIRYEIANSHLDGYQGRADLTQITMLHDDLLLVDIREPDMIPIPYSDAWINTSLYVGGQLVQLTEGEPIVIEVGQVLFVLPGKLRVMIWDGYENATLAHVYDVATGEVTPILRAVDSERYSVGITRAESADTAVVTVYLVVDGKVDVREGVRYTIRF